MQNTSWGKIIFHWITGFWKDFWKSICNFSVINQKLFIAADNNLPFVVTPPFESTSKWIRKQDELWVLCEWISSAEAWENSRHVYGDGCKTIHLKVKGSEMAWMAGSTARKTHVSPGHTRSLPSSTARVVYSPDLPTLSSSSASPLPAWCSQSCFVSVWEI